MEGQGGVRHRRSDKAPGARRYQPFGRRQDAVRRHIHGRDHARLRRVRSAQAEADPREEDRRAGQHGLSELGREAALLYELAPGELGQDRPRQRAVPQGPQLGRQGADPALRNRLHGRVVGPAAHDGVRVRGALRELKPIGAAATRLILLGTKRAMTRALLFGVVFGLAAFVDGADAHDDHPPVPGAGAKAAYAFPIAAPGSYRLPPIKRAAGGAVLDDAGRQDDLGALLRGRVTVLAFVYTRCGDVCPAATLDMAQLQDRAAQDRSLSGRMRLVTMSFDPEHDTPA